MIWHRPRHLQATPSTEPSAAALDTAWRIHQAQSEWTARVDAKAAFAFTLESTAVATALALTAEGRIVSDLRSCWSSVAFFLGVALLLAAAVLAALAVAPRLRSRHLALEAPHNFIYFGHVRHWEAQSLETALLGTPILPQVTRQIVNMAGIAWDKHVRVQWSLWLAIAGAICLITCGLSQALGAT